MNVDNSKNKHTGLIVSTAAVGSVAGGFYSANHISEARTKKIADINLDNVKYFEELADCFDVQATKTKLATGALNKDEFDLVENITNKFKQFTNDEAFLKKVVNTPINERTVSYTAAVKIANKSRREAWGANFKIKPKLTQKLLEHDILDGQRWKTLVQDQLKKTKAAYKIMATPILLGLAAGAGIGTFIGLGIKSLLNNNK